jgi:hypothetical protein
MAKIDMKNTRSTLACLAIALLFTACGKDYVNNTGTGTNAGTSGSLARFAISNNTLYTVSDGTSSSFYATAGNNLTSYDITDNTNPVIQKTSATHSGVAETIFGFQNYLFVGSQNGMDIFDATNPSAPVYKSSYTHVKSCDPVVANANYAFVSLRSTSACTMGLNEVDVVDISNPALPKQVYTYPMTQPYGLALDGNYLFVCDGGVKFYDITNVATPVLKQKVVIDARDVIVQNGKLIVVGVDGLYQYDYSGGMLVLLSKIPTN